MKRRTTLLTIGLLGSALAQGQAGSVVSSATPDEVRAASPALVQYTERGLLREVWKRPGLSPLLLRNDG
jgi:hypothetical protein